LIRLVAARANNTLIIRELGGIKMAECGQGNTALTIYQGMTGSQLAPRSRCFRFFAPATCAVILAFLPIGFAVADDTDKGEVNLRVVSSASSQIRTRADFEGSLLVKNPEKETKESVPLTVAADFQFRQTPVGANDAIRKYETAKAAITLNGKATENVLSEGNRQIAVRINDRKLTRPVSYLSLGGVLRQVEQELLLVPGDPLVYKDLFSRDAVTTGTRWTASDRAVQAFLAIENVIENRLDLMVKEITEGEIKIYLMGDVRGEVDTAITDMHVVGVAIIDRTSETVKALRVTINENRDVSQLAPGFSGQIKLDVRAENVAVSSEESESFRQVSGQKIQNLPLKLLWNTDSQFEMVYDPQWRVILSDPDAVIMRYVKQGNLLAQCSILKLPKRPVDKPLQKAQFAEEIAKMVAESKARVASSDVAMTRSGMTAIRVVVHGLQDDLPVEWRYYHLSNPDGRCIALVFTAEQEAAREFDKADLHLLESVRFPAEQADASQKTAAAGATPRK